jgi:large subunit ribosomal protein L6
MSRIGKKPVPVPTGVKVEIAGQKVSAKGAGGEIAVEVHPRIGVKLEGNEVVLSRTSDEWADKALHGLSRALVANMVAGAAKKFEKKLEIVGVGFGAKQAGKTLELTVGYSKPVKLEIPAGVTLHIPDATHIAVQGVDKQKVGQFAAEIRAVRKPEPYKGTGIKYEGEVIRRKAGKAFGAGGGK